MDLQDALLAENEQLRIRVAQLEAGLAEYRTQMDGVTSSLSWRMTYPLRLAAGRYRLVKRISRKWRHDRSHAPLGTVGLWPPAGEERTPAGASAVARVTASPAALRSPRPVPPGPRPERPVLVVAHVYYPEVWADIADRLVRIPEPFDLVVSVVRGHAEEVIPEILSAFPEARVELVPNRGRDIAALVMLANLGYFDGYEAILKVHTKRSRYRLDGDGWRILLLDALLPSADEVGMAIELLRTNPDVGIIGPPGHMSGPEHWGGNRAIVEALAARLPMAYDPEDLLFAAGSMFWCRPWVLQRLADLDLPPEAFQDEAGHTDGTTAHGIERMVGLFAQASGLETITMDQVASRLQRSRRVRERARVLAFYLPQYHRIDENDRWWGEGFTDWVNVRRAAPLFDGHLQPHVPTELGEYDLSDPGVMRQQAALAREYGIDGFVLHTYWFNGRRLLERPLENLLADPTIDLPFALCWANENWTRRWDGLDSDVLLAQTFPDGWAARFIEDMLPALSDPRYIRRDGAPVLVIYRAGQVPDLAEAVRVWRERCVDAGLGGLHVLAVIPNPEFEDLPDDIGSIVDGLVMFPPGSGMGLQALGSVAPHYDRGLGGEVFSYQAAVTGAHLATRHTSGLRIHPGVMPGWDNTARRGTSACAFHGSNPMTFRRWISAAGRAASGAGPEPLVFVNAWNEWAEGAHLEPDQRFGRGNLEAVRDALPLRSTDRGLLPQEAR